jgi:predicted DNA-binding protein YlxM (UPF0122 family)
VGPAPSLARRPKAKPSHDMRQTARLSAREVREIYAFLADNTLTHAEIADLYAVSRPTVTLINLGRIWKHLTPKGWRPYPRLSARGERNGFAKLCADEARAIYKLAWAGAHSLREIADAFGVSLSQVWLIKHRREWRWLLLDNNEEQAMTDNEEFEKRLAASEKRVAELEARLRGEQPTPIKAEPRAPIDYTANASMDAETKRELAKAFPPDLARQLRNDLARPNPVTEAGSAQLTPDRGRGGVQIVRGTGYRDAVPLGPPAGVELCDQLVDAQDRQDRADLERRLARSVKKE